MKIEEKTILWKPVSEYTGGRVLATNGLDILVGELNPEGDCVSEDCSGTHLCGITHFAKIDGFFPTLRESEDEKIRKALIDYFDDANKADENPLQSYGIHTDKAIAWLEKQGEQKPTLPKWKYKKDNTPLLRDSIILNKYGCVAKSLSGSLVSNVWVIDYDELAKLPKEEIEKQDEQKPYDQRKECSDCQFNYAGKCKGSCQMKINEQNPCETCEEPRLNCQNFPCEKKKNFDFSNKVEPKFKVGDVIKPKDGGHEPWQIMQVDMLDKKYRFKDGCVIHFSQEDAYELIEQKPTDEVDPKFKYGDRVRNKKSGLEQTLGSCIGDIYEGAFPFFINDQDDWELIEQKSSDNVEPKFKVDDWIIYDENIYQIHNIGLKQYYECLRTDGTVHIFDFEYIDSKSRHWTIKDAKDGDVLVSPATKEDKECPFIFKEIDKNGVVRFHVALLKNKDLEISNDVSNVIGYANAGYHIPATKEQRDFLFQKIKEAGYEWDTEKKELKKINTYCQENCKGFQETGRCFADGECKAKKEAEQKSAWSEEDELQMNAAIDICKNLGYTPTSDWLKSLKDRVQPQPKQEWSEEDKDYYDAIIIKLEVTQDDAALTDNQMNFLKSLKNRVQLKQEWSEEDERMLNLIIHDYEAASKSFCGHQGKLEWLKSLKPQNNITDEELAQAKKDAYNNALDKIEYHSGEPTFDDGWSAAIDYIRKKFLRPQNHWKPTEEQMNTMKYLAKYYAKGCDEPTRSIIEGLYEQLKQL